MPLASVIEGGLPDRKIYHGWIVVAATFFVFAVNFAIQYAFGIFFTPLQESFGWSRATTSWAMTLFVATFAICVVPAGWFFDRYNPRALLSVAAVLIGVSLVLCSYISEPWQLYLLYGLPLGMGAGFCGPTIITIVAHWFVRKRGTAMGLTSSGVGFGALVGAPVSSMLISAYGWRNAFIILGIASGLILLVCAYIIRRPSQAELSHENALPVTSKSQAQRLQSEATFLKAVRSRELLLIVLAMVFMVITLRTIQTHIAPHAIDIGASSSVAAMTVGVLGIFSVLGRLVMGYVQDRIGAQRCLIIGLTVEAVAMLALPFIRSGLLLFVFAAVFGFTSGGDVPQVPALTAQCFGMASIGILYGLVQAAGNFAGAFGPIVAGYFFDQFGSYTVVFLATAVGLVAGVFCILKLRLRSSRAS